MNSLVEQYRQKIPNDPRTDEELTLLFGHANDQDGRYNQFTDFVQDYGKVKAAKQLDDVPFSAEFRNALSRGVEGLKESAYGMGALGADVVGADSIRNWMLKKYNDSAEGAMESPAGVGRIEDVNSVETATRWAIGKAGEFIPLIGEAALTAGAGAIAGSAVAPGPGTAAGATAGLAEGFFARQAAKSIVKTGVRKLLRNVAPEVVAEAEAEISRIAGGKAIKEGLHPIVEKMMAQQIPALAKQYGVNAASALNFGAISAGATFGHLRQEESVTPEDARWAALIAGVGGVAPVLVPAAVAKKLFPGINVAKADALTIRVLKEAAAHVPIATGGMTVMEAANIAAERFAKKKDGPLTDEELSRMLNAGVTGAALGLVSGVAAGLPKPKIFDPAVERHFKDVPEDRRSEIVALKTREKLGTLSDTDKLSLKGLDSQEAVFAGLVESMTQAELDHYTVKSTEADRVEPKAEVKTEEPKPVEVKSEPKPEITTEQHKALADLGYTEQDRTSMRPEEAQSIIEAQLQSPKVKARAAAAASTVKKAATVDPAVEAAKKAAEKKKETTVVEPTTSEPVPAKEQGTAPAVAKTQPVSPEVAAENNRIDEDRAGKVASKDYIDQIQKPPPEDVTLETIVASGGGDVKSGDVTIKPGEASVRTFIAELKKTPEKAVEIMDRWQAKAISWVEEADAAMRRMMSGEHGGDEAAFQKDNTAVMRTQTLREPFGEVGGNAESIGLSAEIGREAWRRYRAIEAKMDELSKARNAEKKEEPPTPKKEEKPAEETKPAEEPKVETKPEEPVPDRELKTKPTTKEPPKEEKPTLREAVRTKIDAKQNEIDAIKAQLDAIAKETGEVDWTPSGPESGFMLNPLDLIGIKDPKQIPLLVSMAKLAFESGALKFAEFSLIIIEKLGNSYAQFVASLYEATRNYFRNIAENDKRTQEERDSANATLAKMTPIEEMGDAVLAMGKRVFEKSDVKVYAADHIIKVEDVDVEGRGTRDKSAIGRENPVEAEKLWNELRERDRKRLSKLSIRQAGKSPPLPTWKDMLFIHPKTGKIDTFAQRAFLETLPREIRERIRIAEQVIVEPAFFVPRTRNLEKLSEALLSDSSPPSGKFANSYTFRLADVLDRDTGRIHRVSIFNNNGKAMLTIFDEAVRPKGQGHKSTDRAVSLKDVLANKRFAVIGSLRTKGLTEYYHETFATQKIYRDTFTRDVMSRQKAVQEGARAEQQKMEAHGIEAGADYRQTLDESIANAEFKPGESDALPTADLSEKEQVPYKGGTLAEEPGAADVSTVPSSGAVSTETQAKAKVLNLDANDVRVLRDELPGFETLDELAEMLASPQLISDDVLSLIEKIAKRDVSFFTSVMENGLETTLKDYGYTDAGKGKPVQQGPVAATKSDILPARSAGERGDAGPEAAVEGKQDSAGEPGQEGAGGDAQPDTAGGVKFNLPRLPEFPRDEALDAVLNHEEGLLGMVGRKDATLEERESLFNGLHGANRPLRDRIESPEGRARFIKQLIEADVEKSAAERWVAKYEELLKRYDDSVERDTTSQRRFNLPGGVDLDSIIQKVREAGSVLTKYGLPQLAPESKGLKGVMYDMPASWFFALMEKAGNDNNRKLQEFAKIVEFGEYKGKLYANAADLGPRRKMPVEWWRPTEGETLRQWKERTDVTPDELDSRSRVEDPETGLLKQVGPDPFDKIYDMLGYEDGKMVPLGTKTIPESGKESLAFPDKKPSGDWRIGDTVKPAEGVVLNGLFPEITEGTLTGNVKEQAGVTFRQLMFKHPEDGRPVYIYKPQDYLVNQRTGQSGTRSFNKLDNRQMGLGPEPAKVARTPEEIRHDELVTNIHQAAAAAGIDVSRVQGQFRFGVYDPDTVSIMQVTAEVVGRQDVKTAFHEVAHDVFKNEMPEVRDSILRAIDSMSDKALGVDMSSDTRIRSDDPAKLGKRAVNEERLVDAAAERLTAEGFDPVQARGFAQKFVRALKDFYYKAVMKVQEMFGHEPNGELARRYFENRVKQLLAGDTSRMSYQEWLRIGKPSLATRQDRFFRAREMAERIENGIVTYDHQSDLTMDGARFNNDAMFNLPTEAAGPLTRTIEVEKRVAVLNHLAELQERAASAIESNPELAGKLKGTKKNATQWLRSLLKISDPKDAKDELAKWREVGGEQVEYDAAKKIDGFTGKSNTDAVLVRAFRNTQALRSKVANAAAKAAAGIQELVAKRDEAKVKHDKQAAEYKDYKGQTTAFRREVMRDVKELFNSMMGLSKKAGVIEQQIAELDPTKTLKDYTPVFENLVESNALGSQTLFDVLDAAANDAKVDFTKPITEVRDALLASYIEGGKPYDLLLKDTNQSRALLATVVAFAKTHARTMAELELRREKSGEKRAALESELEELAEQKKDFGKQLTELGKTAKLEERVRKTYYDSVKKIRRFDRAISTAKSRMDAAESVLPVVDAEVARLTGLLDAAPDFTVRDGAVYLAAKPGMSSADLMSRDKETGELKHVQKLALNSSLKATDPAKVHDELLNMKRWLDDRDRAASGGDESAHDNVYQSVKRAYLELGAHLHFKVDQEPAHKFMWEMSISGVFKRLKDAYGTPSSQIVDRIGNLYERVRSTLSREGVVVGHKTMQFENEILKLLPLSRDTLRENILNPVKSLLQFKTRDLPEMFPGQPERVRRAAYSRVREMLLNNKSTGVTQSNVDAVMPALERLIEHQHAANKRQVQMIEAGIQVRNPFTGKYEHSGVGVLDPKLKIYNPATGKMESAVRRFVDAGPWTFSQKLSRNFSTMISALRNADWASFRDTIGESKAETETSPAEPGKLAETYAKSPVEAQKLVDRFFNDKENGDQVREAFFRALAEMPEEAGFDAPLMADGITRPPADPLLVHEAMEIAGPGNFVKFAETLFDLHEGTGSKAEYVQSTAERMAAYFDQIDAMDRRNNPDVGEGSVRSLRGMTPDAMINSRELEGLPGSWFDYHDFDQRDMFRMSERIASEIAFGRGQERLASLVDTVGKEADEAIEKLRKAREELKRSNPDVEGKPLEKLVRKKLGDAYDNLKMFEDRRHLIGKSVIQLSDFFRRDYSPDGTLRVMTRGGQLLGNLMVNNPGSAIYQMAQLFDTIFRYGPSASTLATTGVVVKRAVHESVASLAQMVGIQMGNGSEFHQRFIALGLNDPAVANRFRDAFDRWHGESNPAFALRSINEITQSGLNPLGEKAQHTLLRPAGIFNTSAIIADRALTEGIWNLVGRFVMKGMEFYKENPSMLEDGSHILSQSDLKLSGWNGDRFAFDKLKQDMARWGIDFDSMVKGALARKDKTLITDEDAIRLHSMAMSELSSQANLVTMTPGAWNNSIIRFMIPLLGWSIRRTGDVASKRLGVDGKMSAQDLARGMAALAVISTGGMALSALVDEYYEELLGKKRNLRPILTPGGLLEHSARLGQTGLFGELANGFMNVGTGGDSRIISLDRRVVAVSAFMTIQSAVSAMINQGEVDYARVVRPIVASMGGNGALQYMQMANNAFGLENAEADITRRMNAQNYIRVAGRELGLDVRKFGGGGGYSNTTPMSPHMTRMEMAAYADDAVAFRTAYQGAIKKAQQEGYPDPVDHVKRAFAARNPLRASFQTSPSEKDYNRLLAALPPDGRRDVSSAVDSFNRYAESIGARGFEGREEKTAKVQSPSARMAEFMRKTVPKM